MLKLNLQSNDTYQQDQGYTSAAVIPTRRKREIVTVLVRSTI